MSSSSAALPAERWTGLTVVSLAVLSKGVSFLREPLIASTLGASSSADSYYVAIALPFIFFNLLGLPFSLWVTARLAAIDDNHGRTFYRRSLWLGWTIASVVSIALSMVAGPTVRLYAAGLEGDRFAEAVSLTELATIALPALVLQAIASGRLFAEGRFAAVYSWLAIGSFVGLIGMLILTPHYGAQGATIAFVATWWTSAIGLLLLSSSPNHPFRPPEGVPQWKRELGIGIVYRAVAMQVFFQGGALLTYSFASQLSVGEIAATLFASKIVMAIYETLVLTSGVLVFPRLAQFVQDGNEAGMGRVVMQALEWLIPLTMVLVVLLALGRTDIVAIIYSRRAFDERALVLVSNALVGFAPYIIGVALIEMLHRAMVLRGQIGGYVLVFGMALLANAIACWILVPRLGIIGVSLGSSIGALVAGLGLWAYAQDRLHSLDSKRIGLLGLRTLAAAAVALAILGVLRSHLFIASTLGGRVLVLTGTTLAGLAIFAVIMFALGYRGPSATEEGIST